MDIQAQFDSIQKKLNKLLAASKKETWVRTRWIQDITGWDGKQIEAARQQNIIEHRRNAEGRYEYKIESLPEQFIITKKHQRANADA